jgi:hypothetical protein
MKGIFCAWNFNLRHIIYFCAVKSSAGSSGARLVKGVRLDGVVGGALMTWKQRHKGEEIT